MKATILLTIIPLIASAAANPVPDAQPEPAPIAEPMAESDSGLSKRDNWCTLYPTVSSAPCYYGPGTNGVRTTITPTSGRFGVRCLVNNKWDHIPGWGCYVDRKYTNTGCESTCSPFLDLVCSLVLSCLSLLKLDRQVALEPAVESESSPLETCFCVHRIELNGGSGDKGQMYWKSKIKSMLKLSYVTVV